LLRFSKRSRLTFSSIVEIPPQRRPSEAFSSAIEIDVDEVELLSNREPRDVSVAAPAASVPPPISNLAPVLPKLPPPKLPPPIPSRRPPPLPSSLKASKPPPPLPSVLPVPLPLPPRHPSALHTLPPAPPPRPKRSRISAAATSLAPVAAPLEPTPNFRRSRTPNWIWGAALLVVGAAFGFGAALFAQPDIADQMNTNAMRFVFSNEHVPEMAPTPMEKIERPAPEPPSITFDTPLDIRIPAPVASPTPVNVITPAAQPPAAPAKPVPVSTTRPAVDTPKPLFKTEPRFEQSRPAVAARAGTEQPLARHDPVAMEALVREQLRSTLR
jgi:hypothetical protein